MTGETMVDSRDKVLEALGQEPYGDCISRRSVIDTILNSKSSFKNDFACGFFIDKIRDLPPATLQPKIGHWMYDEKSRVYRCSCCNRFPWRVKLEEQDEIFTDLTRTNAYKFCPNCGAKMTESEK